eukprot:4228858-Pyramimonas_sp.AAC.1
MGNKWKGQRKHNIQEVFGGKIGAASLCCGSEVQTIVANAIADEVGLPNSIRTNMACEILPVNQKWIKALGDDLAGSP